MNGPERPPHIPPALWERMPWHARQKATARLTARDVEADTRQQQEAARIRWHGRQGPTLVDVTRPEAVRLHGDGLTEAQIAERLGVPKARVHRALEGHVTPRPSGWQVTGVEAVRRGRARKGRAA